MATIINNPDRGSDSDSGSGVGMVIAVIVLVVVLVLFFVFALPAIRGTNNGTTVNVPEKVEINVNSSGN